jgi:DNA-binding PadR family transcriptional regulator
MSLSISSKTPLKMTVSPLQILLLIQLETGPKYGYEMLVSLKEDFEGSWEPRTGTVYPALKSLERKGLVETIEKDGTSFYIITPEGREAYDNMQELIMTMLGFSVRYLSVLFKWMSAEKKQNALNLMKGIAEKDKMLATSVLTDFTQNMDKELREPFLKSFKDITVQRLGVIEKLLQVEDEK